MIVTCPQGHLSVSTDYCDTCGAPIGPKPGSGLTLIQGSGPTTTATGGTKDCPNCALPNPASGLFCEGCGFDFTTGTPPRSGPATPATTPLSPVWVAEVWIDPQWYAEQETDQPCPSPGLPTEIALPASGALIGRSSSSRQVHPELDCSPDTGVSRRQAQLSTDGSRWWVEDLGSANGTFIGASGSGLPTTPIKPGTKQELASGDRIYVGAWTRIVIRPATG